MNGDFAELRAACQASVVSRDSEKISEGESIWIMGLPVPADAGHIGLSMAEGHRVVVSESSILEVLKDEHRYLVRVKAGTAAVVRSEAVIALRDTGCGCVEEPAKSAMAKPVAAAESHPDPKSDPDCWLTCHWFNVCSPYRTKGGRSLRVCVPALVCGWYCRGDRPQ